MHSPYEFIDEQRNADLMDAMADLACEQAEAMRESEHSEWSLVDRTNGIIEVDFINGHVNKSTQPMMLHDNTIDSQV